jgi:hypothetical protein
MPILWFGLLAVWFAIALILKFYQANIMLVLAPLLIAAIGYFAYKKYVWNLMDEVFDGGDYLLIKNHGQEAKVPLSDIASISGVSFSNPPRATLKLAQASQFGSEITFAPLSPLFRNPFAKNAVVEELSRRIDATKLNRKI